MQTKPATHGGGSIVELHSQPDVEFHVTPKPLAYGENNFDAVASAAYKAEVTVNLPLFGSTTKQIVDLGAGVQAGRCSFNTLPTRFKVLGDRLRRLQRRRLRAVRHVVEPTTRTCRPRPPRARARSASTC